MQVGTLFSGSSTDQMLGAGFKMLVDQNKILIRQNGANLETMRKLLKKEKCLTHEWEKFLIE